jgi:hypothetical protein
MNVGSKVKVALLLASLLCIVSPNRSYGQFESPKHESKHPWENKSLVWSKFSSRQLPHARTSLRAQAHDKSGSVDPLLGPDRKHPYTYVRVPDTTRGPYLYAYAASRS